MHREVNISTDIKNDHELKHYSNDFRYLSKKFDVNVKNFCEAISRHREMQNYMSGLRLFLFRP